MVEVAPSIGLPQEVVDSLCDAGVKLAESVGYDNAGTVEFLLDQETNEWFFIEMNPRIQVEHTVTEQITGIDIVRSQILIAMNHDMHGKKISIPKQHLVPRNGCVRFNVELRPRIRKETFLRIMAKFSATDRQLVLGLGWMELWETPGPS